MKMFLGRRRAEHAPIRWVAAALAATSLVAPALVSVIAASPAEAAGGGSVSPGQPTLSNPVAGGASNYTIPFMTSASGALLGGGTITIVAPSGTVFPACLSPCSNYLVNGANAASVVVSPSNQIVVTIPSSIANSTLVNLVANGVSNPTTAGSYTLQESTSVDTTAATSPTYQITAGSPNKVVATLGDNQSAGISSVFTQPLVATVADAFGNPETPSGDTIKFSAPTSGASAAFTTGSSNTVNPANGHYTSSAVTANGTTGSYSVSATLMNGVNPVVGVTTGSFSLTNLAGPPPGSVSPGSLTLGSSTAGASTSYQIPFTPTAGGSLPNGATITFVAPGGTAFPASTCVVSCSGYSITAGTGSAVISAIALSMVNGSTSNNKVVLTVTVTSLQNLSGLVTVAVSSVGNPTLANTYVIQESTSTDPTATNSPTYTVVPGVASKVVAVSGTPQTATVGTSFQAPLVAALEDSFGNGISGQPVTFTIGSVNNASASFANGTTTEPDQTGPGGTVTSSIPKANSVVGSYSVIAAVPNSNLPSATFFLANGAGQVVPSMPQLTSAQAGAGSVGYSISFRTVHAMGSAATITITFPSGTIISSSASNYTVTLNGNPESGTAAPNVGAETVTITLSNSTLIAGGATFVVTANGLTNPTKAGPYSLLERTSADNTPASSPSYSIIAGPVNMIVRGPSGGGSGQSAEPGATFATPLSAMVEDQFSNPVSAVAVTFSAPASGATATFASCQGGNPTANQCTVNTDSSGTATSSVLTANSTAGGPYTVNANAGAIGPATFSLTNAQVLAPQAIVVTPATAGGTATYQIPLVTSSSGALPNSGSCPPSCQIVMVAPNGTSLPTTKADYSIAANNNHGATIGTVAVSNTTGPGSGSVSATANRVVISLDSSSILGGDLVTVTIINVTNPKVASTGYMFSESTTSDGPPVTSPSYSIAAAAPATLSVIAGSPQSQTVAGQYNAALEVNVVDSFGNAVSGTPVTFSAPASGATVTFAACPGAGSTISQCVVNSDTQGNAVASTMMASHVAGTFSVTASAASGSLTGTFNLANVSGPTNSLNVVSGNGQSAVVNSPFGPLEVQATDVYSNPVAGSTVVFTAPASGPSATFSGCQQSDPANQCTVVTDSSGHATTSAPTANSVAGGPYTVTASDPAIIANFSLTNLTGAASRVIVLGGSNQETLIFNPFDSALQAKITDNSGNPISGAAVTFIAPASGATATFDPCAGGNPSPNECTVTTDASGIATSSALTAGDTPGTFGVQISVQGASVQAFTLTDLQSGYWTVASDGGIFTFGGAPFYGSTGGRHLNRPIVGMTETNEGGYYLVASDGGIFNFGPGATYYGSTGAQRLNSPIVGMALDPQTGGYWLVASDGGVFNFNAPFWGSMGGQHLNSPVVGMGATPEGGYYMVASDGGIFTFGPGATFYGSTGGMQLNAPIVGMAVVPDLGYYLVASDGGIFNFGPGAVFLGSEGGQPLNQPIVGMAIDPATGGYWLVASDGGIFEFGAPFYGSTGAQHLNAPMVGMSSSA